MTKRHKRGADKKEQTGMTAKTPESKGSPEREMIRELAELLNETGLSENTIVWYSTDNGPEHASWPHGGTTPFRGEKMTNYEGGIRVPSMIRWPGVLPAGERRTGIQAHQDMFTTLAVAAGIDDPVERVRTEMNQYIDGINNLPYWQGEAAQSARNHLFLYYESILTAVRMGPWKFHFSTKEDYYANLVPRTVPRPPVRAAPPITTAAIAVSS